MLTSLGRWICGIGLIANLVGFVAYGVWHRQHQAKQVRHYQWNRPAVSVPEVSTWAVRLTEGRTIFSDLNRVQNLVIGSDGKRLLVSGERGVEAWDLELGTRLRSLPPSRAANPEMKKQPIKTFPYPDRLSGKGDPLLENGVWPEKFSFGKSGVRVLGYRTKGVPRIWNLETGEVEEIEPDSQFANIANFSSATWSPDERTFYVSGANDLTIGLFRMESRQWERLTVDEIHGRERPWHWYDSLQQVCISDDGALIAAAGFPSREWSSRGKEEKSDLYVLESQSGKQVQRLRQVANAGTFQFSGDGEWIVMGSADGSIDFWNIKSGEKKRGFSAIEGELLQDFAISPDGKLIVTSSTFNETNRTIKTREAYLQVWDAETGKEQLRLTSPVGSRGVEFGVAKDWSRLAWWVSSDLGVSGGKMRALPGERRSSYGGQVWVWDLAVSSRRPIAR